MGNGEAGRASGQGHQGHRAIASRKGQQQIGASRWRRATGLAGEPEYKGNGNIGRARTLGQQVKGAIAR